MHCNYCLYSWDTADLPHWDFYHCLDFSRYVCSRSCDYTVRHSLSKPMLMCFPCITLQSKWNKNWPWTHKCKLDERSQSAWYPLDTAELFISKLQPLHHCTAAAFTHNCKSLCITTQHTVETRRGGECFLCFKKTILMHYAGISTDKLWNKERAHEKT